MLAETFGNELRYVPVKSDLTLDMEALEASIEGAGLVCGSTHQMFRVFATRLKTSFESLTPTERKSCLMRLKAHHIVKSTWPNLEQT